MKRTTGRRDPTPERRSRSAWITDRVESGSAWRAWVARALVIAVFVVLFASAGCEVLTFERTSFPDQFVGADGQDVVLDDVNAVLADPDLAADPDGQRQALRDLGIEDEDLLDALLAGE